MSNKSHDLWTNKTKYQKSMDLQPNYCFHLFIIMFFFSLNFLVFIQGLAYFLIVFIGHVYLNFPAAYVETLDVDVSHYKLLDIIIPLYFRIQRAYFNLLLTQSTICNAFKNNEFVAYNVISKTAHTRMLHYTVKPVGPY